MRLSMRLTTVLLLAGTLTLPAVAGVVADFQGDFLPGSSNGQTRPAVAADGWDYMWNASAAIGTAAGNYSSLKSWGSSYNFDGAGGLPRANPAAYVYLHGSGGHPGRGVNQGGGVDRYAIGAYTLQAGEGGLVRIANSALSVSSANSNGVDTRVYVNDTLAGGFVQPGGGAGGSFNAALGFLNAGDTVYVAMGPNVHDGSDSFSVRYQLETFTDATSLMWDADGVPPVDGGTGTWDNSANRWVPTTGPPHTSWSANSNAIFLGNSGTVTLGAPVAARSLSFSADGYTMAGANPLTMTTAGTGGPGPAIIEVPLGTATISVPISGSTLSKIGSGTLVLDGATITVPAINASGGNLALAGSSVTNASNLVRVGVSSTWVAGGSSGTLTIQDSASLTTGRMFMGENWPFISGMRAVINQTGGTVTITGTTGENAAIRIGHWGNETSTYNLSGGVLNITSADQDLAIGTDGAGIFYQTGGEAFAPGVMVNHRNANGSATFTVRGGTFNIGARGIQTAGGPATVQIGGAGGTIKASASFASPLNMTITGGGNNGAFFDTNGNNISLSGALGGGTLNKVGDGTLTLTGGTHNLAHVNVGDGALTLTGSPTVNISGGLVVANNRIAGLHNLPVTAQLNIDSGSLVSRYITMGDAWGGAPVVGTINQTGGTVTTTGTTAENNGLRLGHWPAANVTYRLSGGTLTVGDNRDLSTATDGTGYFLQTGGVANARRVVVNKRNNTGGNGTFEVRGGIFNLGSGGIITDHPSAPSTVLLGGLGGTLAATASWSSSLPMTLSGTGANAIHFDTNGNAITLSGPLSGTGGLNKVGAGTLNITGTSNTFRGPTTVSGGRLSVSNGRLYDIGWANAVITVNNGGTLEVGGWADGDTLGIGRVSFNPANILIDDGAIFYVGNSTTNRPDRGFTIGAGGATLDASGGNEWHIARIRSQFPMVSAQGGLLTLTGTTTGRISKSIPGSGGLLKTGTGTWTLEGNHTFTGPTTVSGGTLALNTGMLYPNAGWANRLITVNNGGVIEVGGWADGDTLGIGRVSFNPANILIDDGAIFYVGNSTTNRADRGFTIGAGGATLGASGGNTWRIAKIRSQFPIVSTQGGLLTLTGTTTGLISKDIPGSGGLTKTGTGTWTLTGNNTYTGATNVDEGALFVNGSIASSPLVTVASGATLGGSGSVGPVDLLGIVAPGDGVGTLNAGNTLWDGGASYLWEINDFDGTAGADPGWDLLDILGTLTIDATEASPFTVHLASLGLPATPAGLLAGSDPFEIVRASDGIAGFDWHKFVLDPSGLGVDLGGSYFTIIRDGNSLFLDFVPEPTSLTLLGLGGLAALLRRRRRRRS